MNVAIIGCGYVGSAVAHLWHQELGLSTTVTTTTPERVPELKTIADRVVVVKGNDPIGLESVVKNQEIILLSVGAANGKVYQETYLDTAQTLVSVLKTAPTVRQLIYTGSYAVYGDRQGGWVDETSPIAPPSPNYEILAETEQVLLSASNPNLKVCILRLGGIYGPKRELLKIFGRFAGTTREGSGQEVTNWIHLDDIVGAIEFVRSHQLQGIYNLVDDQILTYQDLLEKVFKQHNLPSVSWDSSVTKARPYNARVSNKKIIDAGYQLIHPEKIF
ncbi:NAD-dependent epimerase/dehydratase family protein [Moorena producens]|uniref:NAD-dependent epimerase/dehydratase family protein n=1 Tax=Moorena producens TaxID=1155739 RepID=UPI003C725965